MSLFLLTKGEEWYPFMRLAPELFSTQLITAETKKMYTKHKNKANFTNMSKITLLII